MKPITTVYTIETGENYGIAFPKGSALLDRVNSVLEQILKSDDWINLINKYM